MTFDEGLDVPNTCSREMLALRDALEELDRLNPRQAEMVKSRFFGGLHNAEIAALLGVAVSTVDRDWRTARAWLKAYIRRTT